MSTNSTVDDLSDEEELVNYLDGASPFIVFFVSAITSSLELYFGMAIGICLSHPTFDILSNRNLRYGIGRIMVFIFTPVFMFRNFGMFLEYYMIRDVWVLPVWGIFHLVLTYLIAELCYPYGFYHGIRSIVRKILERYFFTVENNEGAPSPQREKSESLRKRMRREAERMMYVFASSIPNCAFLPMIYCTSLTINSRAFVDEEEAEEHVWTFVSLYYLLHYFFFYGYIVGYIASLVRFVKKSISRYEDALEEELKEYGRDLLISHDEEEISRSDEDSKLAPSSEEPASSDTSSSVDLSEFYPKVIVNENGKDEEPIEDSIIEVVEKEEEEELEEGGAVEGQRSEEGSTEEEDRDQCLQVRESSEELKELNYLGSFIVNIEKGMKERKIPVSEGQITILGYCCVRCYIFWKSILFNPILYGILFGTAIAFIPNAKNFVFHDDPPVFVGITNIIEKLANCTLPLSLIVVGANMGANMFPREEANKETIGIANCYWVGYWFIKGGLSGLIQFSYDALRPRYVNLVLALKSIFLKLIFIPLMTFLVLSIFILTGVGKYLVNDDVFRPLIYLVILVQGAVPLMLHLDIIMAAKGLDEKVLTEVMIYQYLLAPISMAFFGTFFMYFICSFEKCLI